MPVALEGCEGEVEGNVTDLALVMGLSVCVSIYQYLDLSSKHYSKSFTNINLLQDSYYYYLHFTNEETDEPRG